MSYDDIKQTKQYNELMIRYNSALNLVLNQLDILIKEREFYTKEVIVDHIKSRIKSFDSAADKLIRRGYEVNCTNIEEQVRDMVGVRIVCPFLSDVYKVVKMIKKNNAMKIKSEQDFIEDPKESGYRSYHLNVLIAVSFLNRTREVEVEIQIRTLAMDFWSALDHQIRYKYPGNVPENIEKEMHDISNSMMLLDDKMVSLDEKMKKIKEENDLV